MAHFSENVDSTVSPSPPMALASPVRLGDSLDFRLEDRVVPSVSPVSFEQAHVRVMDGSHESSMQIHGVLAHNPVLASVAQAHDGSASESTQGGAGSHDESVETAEHTPSYVVTLRTGSVASLRFEHMPHGTTLEYFSQGRPQHVELSQTDFALVDADKPAILTMPGREPERLDVTQVGKKHEIKHTEHEKHEEHHHHPHDESHSGSHGTGHGSDHGPGHGTDHGAGHGTGHEAHVTGHNAAHTAGHGSDHGSEHDHSVEEEIEQLEAMLPLDAALYLEELEFSHPGRAWELREHLEMRASHLLAHRHNPHHDSGHIHSQHHHVDHGTHANGHGAVAHAESERSGLHISTAEESYEPESHTSEASVHVDAGTVVAIGAVIGGVRAYAESTPAADVKQNSVSASTPESKKKSLATWIRDGWKWLRRAA